MASMRTYSWADLFIAITDLLAICCIIAALYAQQLPTIVDDLVNIS